MHHACASSTQSPEPCMCGHDEHACCGANNVTAGAAHLVTFWMLHDGNIARFRANDRLIGQPPNPSTTNNKVTLHLDAQQPL
jgi:hypothetical protein